MFDQNDFPFALFLVAGYIDLGTTQNVVSSLGPVIATASAFFLGFFGFFFTRIKKFIKKIWPFKKS
ncbi:MAG: hypothetical protein ABIB61_04270 [Candidatus Shapirobacteria bacterium]